MISLTIVACHDIFQRLAMERGFLTPEYQEHSAVVSMSAKDMNALGVKDKEVVKLSNGVGSVVLQARLDTSCEPGFGYMPMSLYLNMLASYQPAEAKLPNFKNIEVVAEPSDGDVTPITDVWDCIVRKDQRDA